METMKPVSRITGSWVGAILMLAATSAILHAPLADAAANAQRRLTTDELFSLESVGTPVISPDGAWVAYTVESIDRDKNARESAVWMIERSGGEPLRMTGRDGDAYAPRWSPDGTYLSFLSARDEGETQVWVLNRSGGDAQQLTEVDQGVTAYEWSPDGGRLLLVIEDPEPERSGEAKESDGNTPKPWVIDRLQFKEGGVGYQDRRRTHLYILDLESKKPTQLTDGDFDDSEPAWSPDGRSVAFVSNRSANPDANYNTDIWLARADKPEAKRAVRQLTTSPGSDESPVWSPDGSRIAYVAMPNIDDLSWYAMERIAIVSANGGEPTILTGSVDRRVGLPRFSPMERRSISICRISAAHPSREFR